MNNKQPILVFGGTGHYGQHIVNSLVMRGEPVKVLTRNPENARKLLGEVPELLEGDIRDYNIIKKALSGVRAVIISVSGFSPSTIKYMMHIEKDAVKKVLDVAKKMDIHRIVYISVLEIKEDAKKKLKLESASIKAYIEDCLRCSGFNYTTLGAPPSMNLFISLVKKDKMIMPGDGSIPLPVISPVDVGEITAQTVLRDDLSGERIKMTGPEAITFNEALDVINEISGKSIKAFKIPFYLPAIMSVLLYPFSLFSYKILYIKKIMKFIILLKYFKGIKEMVNDNNRLLKTYYNYKPTQFEKEVRKNFQFN